MKEELWLKQAQINSHQDLMECYKLQLNSKKEISKLILSLKMTIICRLESELTTCKLSLVDLAGSERGATSKNQGQRQLEGANINKSLLALGTCIKILSDKSKKGCFVPYRDSKLTRLLKDSLGGNTKTSMIACISPSAYVFQETINTLKYAERAKYIQKSVFKCVNQVQAQVSEYKSIIQALQGEISTLRLQLRKQDKDNTLSPNVSPAVSHNNYQIPQTTQMTQVSQAFGSQMKQISQIAQSQQLCQVSQQVAQISQLPQELTNGEKNLIKKELKEIDTELTKTKVEKEKLEVEIIQNEDRVTESLKMSAITEKDQFYLDKISQSLLSNFEENWEIKQSISELKQLKYINTEQV